jgi:hypothetical protein
MPNKLRYYLALQRAQLLVKQTILLIPKNRRQLQKTMTLATTLALYAWHSEHHLNHILQLRKRMKW